MASRWLRRARSRSRRRGRSWRPGAVHALATGSRSGRSTDPGALVDGGRRRPARARRPEIVCRLQQPGVRPPPVRQQQTWARSMRSQSSRVGQAGTDVQVARARAGGGGRPLARADAVSGRRTWTPTPPSSLGRPRRRSRRSSTSRFGRHVAACTYTPRRARGGRCRRRSSGSGTTWGWAITDAARAVAPAR